MVYSNFKNAFQEKEIRGKDNHQLIEITPSIKKVIHTENDEFEKRDSIDSLQSWGIILTWGLHQWLGYGIVCWFFCWQGQGKRL